MKTITITKPTASIEINSVCVDTINYGNIDTPWGNKPRLELVFETDAKDEFGNPRFISRTFNFYNYPKAALTLEMKNWLGRDISGDDEWDEKEAVGKQAKLLASETTSSSGKVYWKIEAINPAGAAVVQPSGNYSRLEWI